MADERFDAVQFTADLFTDLIAHKVKSYDAQRARAESFMVTTGGQATWVWFVFDVDGDIDHCYVEHRSNDNISLVPVSRVLWNNLYGQLTKESSSDGHARHDQATDAAHRPAPHG